MNDENFKINYENNIKKYIIILLSKLYDKIEDLLRPNEKNFSRYKIKYDEIIGNINPLKDEILELVNTDINNPEVYNKIKDLITYFCNQINKYFSKKIIINRMKSGLQDKFKEVYKLLVIFIRKNYFIYKKLEGRVECLNELNSKFSLSEINTKQINEYSIIINHKNFFNYIPYYEIYNNIESYTKYMKLVNPQHFNFSQNLLNSMDPNKLSSNFLQNNKLTENNVQKSKTKLYYTESKENKKTGKYYNFENINKNKLTKKDLNLIIKLFFNENRNLKLTDFNKDYFENLILKKELNYNKTMDEIETILKREQKKLSRSFFSNSKTRHRLNLKFIEWFLEKLKKNKALKQTGLQLTSTNIEKYPNIQSTSQNLTPENVNKQTTKIKQDENEPNYNEAMRIY